MNSYLYLNYIVLGAFIVSLIALAVSLVFLIEQLTRYYKAKTIEIEQNFEPKKKSDLAIKTKKDK